MNKFTLVIMAALCTIMISCSEQELETSLQLDTQIASRSVSYPIQVVATSSAGIQTTYLCTRAEFSYLNSAVVIDMTTGDNTVVSIATASATLATTEEYTLEVSLDESSTFMTDDLTVQLCETQLCYENNAGTQIGAALEFIVEDEAEGI